MIIFKKEIQSLKVWRDAWGGNKNVLTKDMLVIAASLQNSLICGLDTIMKKCDQKGFDHEEMFWKQKWFCSILRGSSQLNPSYGSFRADAINTFQSENGVSFDFEDHDITCSYFNYDKNRILAAKHPTSPMEAFLYIFPIYAESILILQKTAGVEIDDLLYLFGINSDYCKEHLKVDDDWTSEDPFADFTLSNVLEIHGSYHPLNPNEVALNLCGKKTEISNRCSKYLPIGIMTYCPKETHEDQNDYEDSDNDLSIEVNVSECTGSGNIEMLENGSVSTHSSSQTNKQGSFSLKSNDLDAGAQFTEYSLFGSEDDESEFKRPDDQKGNDDGSEDNSSGYTTQKEKGDVQDDSRQSKGNDEKSLSKKRKLSYPSKENISVSKRLRVNLFVSPKKNLDPVATKNSTEVSVTEGLHSAAPNLDNMDRATFNRKQIELLIDSTNQVERAVGDLDVICNPVSESIEISAHSQRWLTDYCPNRVEHINTESTRIAALALAGCNLKEIGAILECAKKRTCKKDVSVEEKERCQKLLKTRSEENINA